MGSEEKTEINLPVKRDLQDSDNNTRYVKGTVERKLTTKNGNGGLILKKAGFVYPIDGGGNFIRDVENEVFILIPRRRISTREIAKKIPLKKKVLCKLVRESKSKKLACTNIYEWN